MTSSQAGRALTAIATLFLLLVFAAAQARAENFWADKISISNISTAETRPTADVAHVSLTISNLSEEADTLIFVDVPARIAAAAGIASISPSVYRGGLSVQMAQPVFLKPGVTRTLDLTDIHLVLYGLRQPLKSGQEFPIRLSFERAGTVEATVQVGEIGIVSTQFKPAGENSEAPPESERRFKCTDGHNMALNLTRRDAAEVAIVDIGDGKHVLPMQPWDGGEPRVTWSDGQRSLVWNVGVQLMWMDGATHLHCGGGHHSH